MSVELISLNEAARRGITRLREPDWANAYAHMQIEVVDGAPGPWVQMWSPLNDRGNGGDPHKLFISRIGLRPDDNCLLVYDGPLPESEEYRKEAVKFAT